MVPSPSLSNIWKVSVNSAIYSRILPLVLHIRRNLVVLPERQAYFSHSCGLACSCVNLPPGIGFRNTIGCLHSSQKLGRHFGPSLSSSFLSAILTIPPSTAASKQLLPAPEPPCFLRCHGHRSSSDHALCHSYRVQDQFLLQFINFTNLLSQLQL